MNLARLVAAHTRFGVRRGVLNTLCTVLALSAGASFLSAQTAPALVSFTVASARTGEPLVGAQIRLASGHAGVTNERGILRFESVAPEPVEVDVRLLGYAPRHFTVRPQGGTPTQVTVALAEQPIALATLPVSGEAAGFYARKRRGSGFYIDRADIERQRPGKITDLLRNVPGVELIPTAAGAKVQMRAARASNLRWTERGVTGNEIPTAAAGAKKNRQAVSHAARTVDKEKGPEPVGLGAALRDSPSSRRETAGDCAVQYYLDGARFEPMSNGVIGDEIPPAAIEGIEVYRRVSEVPGEYRRPGAECGVILIWTRK